MGEEVLVGVILVMYVIVAYVFSRLGDAREIGSRRLFLISLLLTPIMGLAFFLSSQHRKINPYTEISYKCERCGYVFTESYPQCPFCMKEGIEEPLKKVNKFMT